MERPWLVNIQRAKQPARRPTVLTRAEVTAGLDRLAGTVGLTEARLTPEKLPVTILCSAVLL